MNTNYESEKYFELITEENKTVLFVKPTKEDSIDILNDTFDIENDKLVYIVLSDKSLNCEYKES